MRPATLSILGLYRYDPTLFDNFQIPTALDKTVLIDNLLLECAELEVLYPDLDFLKFIIGRWRERSESPQPPAHEPLQARRCPR